VLPIGPLPLVAEWKILCRRRLVIHIPFRQRISSYFRPISLKRADSTISGYLDLLLYRNRFHLLAADASYSDGARYFPAVAVARHLRKFLPAARNVLVLGAGLGSIVEVMRARGYAPHYTLVEKDKTVLEWAIDILGNDESLEPVLADAELFMAENGRKYDLVFVDIFRGKSVPGFVTSPAFLRQCRDSLSPGGRLALNYIEVHKNKWEKVQRVFVDVFPGSHIVSKEANRILIAAPLS
jgi:SAM-dependent methyltransferase